MYFELGLISVIVAGGYWGWFHLRKRRGTVLFGALLALSALLSALGLLGRYTDVAALEAIGAIGVGAGTCLLIIGPSLRALARRFSARDHFEGAARLLDLAEILSPGSGVSEDRALIGAMREIREGKIEQTVGALTAAKSGAPPEAQLAIDERIAMLYLASHRWAEAVAHAEQHVWPAARPATVPAPAPPVPASSTPPPPTAPVPTAVAVHRALGVSPPVWVELVGAYGRTGDLERAAALVDGLEDACATHADAAPWIDRARLMFLALAGRVAAVERLTSGASGRHVGRAARTYWRAVAHERHGDTAAAAAAYERARDRSHGRARELVDVALAGLPSARAVELGPRATEVATRVEAAPSPRVVRPRRDTGPLATYALTAAVVAVTAVVTAFVGSSGDPGVLLRAGAMERVQIHAGEWWRVVSCVFVHVGVTHMVLNAISLWMIGRICEQLLGRARVLAIFFGAGIAGGVASYLASPVGTSAGASGAVMGLLGAVFVELTLHRGRYQALWRRGVWGGIAIVTVAEVGTGFLVPVVDQWAHGAGLAAGAVLAALLSPHARWRRASLPAATAVAIAGAALSVFAAVQVARTSVEASLTTPPLRDWDVDGLTVTAPTAWALSNGELYDSDIFLVLSVFRASAPGGSLDRELAAYLANEGARAAERHFDQVAPATERVVPLPAGWTGSELEVSDEDPLGDRTHYRVVVAGAVIRGRITLVSLYAPDSIATDHPDALTALLATAR